MTASNVGRSFFDSAFIDEVRASVDIAEIVGETVALKRQGRNYLGLCPFHTEKTPSFTVSPEKQIYHCFGCGVGGDVFSFVVRRDGLSFPEAVRKLAERAGIRVPEPELTPGEAKRRSDLDQIRNVLELASAQYQRWLWSDAGRQAQQYLERRGFDKETLSQFQIGWAPAGWDGLVGALTKRGVAAEWLVRAGLASEAEDKRRLYDRFRSRVMFPIWDQRGRTVAFGGRILPGSADEDKAPKYLNSPETEVFVKGRQLYGYHLARTKIRESGRAIVVEGYVDAMTCHRAGFRNAVASLGTALTVAQGRILMGQARQVLVAYDADAAGQGATVRGLDVLTGLGADVRVVRLPEGKDPDECICRRGPEAFAAAIDDAQDYVAYRFDLAARGAAAQFGQGSARAAAAIAAAIAPTLTALDSVVAREAYVRQFARALDVSEASLMSELRRAAEAERAGRRRVQVLVRPGERGIAAAAATPRAAGGSGAAAPAVPGEGAPGHNPSLTRDNKGNIGSGLLGGPAYRRAQEQLIGLMLVDPEHTRQVQASLKPDDFPDDACRGIARALFEMAAAGDTPATGGVSAGGGVAVAAADEGAGADRFRHEVLRVLEQSGQHEAAALLTRLLMAESTPEAGVRARVCSDCIRALQEHSLTNRISEVRQEVQRLEREGSPVPSRLLEEYTRLVRATKGNSLPTA